MSKQNYIKENNLYYASEPISIDMLKTIIDYAEKSVCKIKCNYEGYGTGFFCLIPFPDKFNLLPVLITNSHVINKNDISKGKLIKFSLNDEKKIFEISIDSSRKTYTNEKYDITIIEIKKTDNLNFNNFLEIDENIFKDNLNDIYRQKSIYLIYYSNERKASFSNGLIENINEDKYKIVYLCKTKSGSLGCPIINLNNNRVIGIHKGEVIKNWKKGTFIKEPIKNFYEENNNKKQNNEKNEDKKDKINIEDKKEKKNDIEKKNQNKNDSFIEYLPEDYPKYDLSFKLLLIGHSGKIIYIKYIYLFI